MSHEKVTGNNSNIEDSEKRVYSPDKEGFPFCWKSNQKF